MNRLLLAFMITASVACAAIAGIKLGRSQLPQVVCPEPGARIQQLQNGLEELTRDLSHYHRLWSKCDEAIHECWDYVETSTRCNAQEVQSR